MTMLTVDDLARDLKVRNEDLLKELVTMGYDVQGPESPLETDDPVALRDQLVTVLPQREVIEKRIKPTVIRRRVKKKPTERVAKTEEPRAAEPEAVPEPPPPPEEKPVPPEKAEAKTKATPKKPVKKAKKTEAAKIIEKAPPPPPKAEVVKPQKVEAKAEPEPEPEPIEEKAVEPPVAAEPAVEEPVEEVPVQAEAPEPVDEKKTLPEKPAKKKKKKEKKIEPAQIIGKVDLKKETVPEVVEPPPAAERPEPRRPAIPEKPMAPSVVAPEPSPEEADARKKRKKKTRERIDDKPDEEKGKIRRRKEVLLRHDLYDDRPRHGRLRTKGRKPRQRKTEITTPKASKRRVKLPEVVTVADLAHKMSVKSAEVIQHLLSLGVTATMHEGIDFDTAVIVASEFGFEAESSEHSEKELLPVTAKDSEENLKARPPVITVMGHVDHGKTSILDFIRSSHVTDQESGGITQHIGAYKVTLDRGEIVFLDTPGHEAFTAMRARGAHVTDFVVLVVAADDGVKEQTREAINHARAAGVPIVVAVNKIDKQEADRDRVTRELSELDLIPEDWGGETLFTYVSAKTGEGVDEFLETILLQAEVMELKANPGKTGSGTIVEARLDKGKGPVATVLVRDGTLRLGDPFVAGTHHGKIRAMIDHEGRNVTSASPATPVEVQGFSGVPEAGEIFIIVDDDKIAKQIGTQRLVKQKQKDAVLPGPVSLDDLLARMQEKEIEEFNIVIKGDVQGSVEALKEALVGLSLDEVQVKIIHEGVGTVTDSDVMLASASGALIIGFNVRPSPKTSQLAEDQRVDIRLYTVIYEAIEDVQKATLNMLAPVEKEIVVGRAEVREVFNIPRVGTVAGCHVTSGKISRSNSVRLLRDDVPVYEGKISSMKRYKDDVKEVAEGYECGIGLENYRDVKIGDIIEGFTIEQEAATAP